MSRPEGKKGTKTRIFSLFGTFASGINAGTAAKSRTTATIYLVRSGAKPILMDFLTSSAALVALSFFISR